MWSFAWLRYGCRQEKKERSIFIPRVVLVLPSGVTRLPTISVSVSRAFFAASVSSFSLNRSQFAVLPSSHPRNDVSSSRYKDDRYGNLRLNSYFVIPSFEIGTLFLRFALGATSNCELHTLSVGLRPLLVPILVRRLI